MLPDKLPRLIALMGLAAYLLCSANLLTWLGVPYALDGGNPICKIHPGTYLIIGASVAYVVSRAMRRRIPSLTSVSSLCACGYLIGILLCVVYATITTGKGNVIVLLDTFLPAGLVALMMLEAEERYRNYIRSLLQIFILANAILALAEAVAQRNFIPLFLQNGELQTNIEEFRPTAFCDHPLTGGMLMMIGLAVAPAGGALPRLVYCGILSIGLLAFGGRVAVACTVTAAVAYRILLLGQAIGQREPGCGRRALIWFSGFAGFILLFAGLIAGGLGQRLAAHMYWDASAQVRLAQWHILDILKFDQLALGTRRDDLIAHVEWLRLDQGVEVLENFWLLLFVSLGASGFLIFCGALLMLLWGLWDACGLRGRILILSVIVAASSSNSLGRKSCLLTILVAAVTSTVRVRNDNPAGEYTTFRHVSRFGLG